MNNTTPKLRKRFDPAFKQAALDLLRTSGKTRKEIAAELGISEWNLRDWKQDQDRATRSGSAIGSPVRPRTLAELEAENLRLRRELISLRNQRDILKKSLGILSEPPTSASHI